MGGSSTEAQSPPIPTTQATSPSVLTDAVERYKVLIVEDTMELAEVIQATLERMNMQAVSEAHALKALEIYEKMQPDVILLDIGLPDMPGWKLLDAIKAKVQAAPEKTLPVIIVITAYGDPANRLMGKLQEVSRYLIKPFTPNEVEKVVQEALAQRHNKSAENPTEASEPTGNSPQDGTK